MWPTQLKPNKLILIIYFYKQILTSYFYSSFAADNESDSGYDPSLYSSLGQSGSLRLGKSRPSLQGVFPEIRIEDVDAGKWSPLSYI